MFLFFYWWLTIKTPIKSTAKIHNNGFYILMFLICLLISSVFRTWFSGSVLPMERIRNFSKFAKAFLQISLLIHLKTSENLTYLTPWYVHVSAQIREKETLGFLIISQRSKGNIGGGGEGLSKTIKFFNLSNLLIKFM